MADLYSGGDEFRTGKSNINDVYLVHSPLARQTFLDLTLSKASYEIRLSAFHQVLNGLAHLHSHGIMHRDIKPTNLMMVSYHPVHAIIIDYGSATFDESSLDHYCGTIAYLAPEVLRLKYAEGKDELEPYECRVDIWSMGLSGYQLFFQEPCKWEKGVSNSLHGGITSVLKSVPASISPLLESMLAWKSSDRPNAKELLKSSIWPQDTEPPLEDAPRSPPSTHIAKRSKLK